MRKYLLKGLLATSLLVLFSVVSYSQVTIFSETFNEVPSATSGSSLEGINWNASCPSCPVGGFMRVQNGRLESRNVDGPAVWSTDDMDISNCSYLEIDMSYIGSVYGTVLEDDAACAPCGGNPANPSGGNCNTCWDFSLFELVVDGVPTTMDFIGATNTPTTASIAFNTCSVGASTGSLQVTMQNWEFDERQRIDNVMIVCYEEGVYEVSGEQAVCADDAGPELYSVAPATGSAYSWSTTGGTPASNTTGTSFGVDWSTAAIGSYVVTVEVTDPQGCLQIINHEVFVISDAPGAMACNGALNITLDVNCSLSNLTADLFLEDMQYTNDAYTVELFDDNDDPILASNGSDYIGQTVTVEVTSKCGGNSCWGTLLIEDKSIPVLECGPVSPVDCDMLDVNLGFPTNVGTPIDNGNGTFTVLGYDNCGDATLSYTDFTVATLCSDPVFSSIVERTWTIVDDNGYSSSCSVMININKADVNDVVWPPHYDPAFGTSSLDACSNFPTLANGHPDPYANGGTGSPSGSFCLNIEVSYTDIHFDGECEIESKILRKWVAEDLCTGTTAEYTQNILIMVPANGFVVTCPPDNVVDQIPTDNPYNCTANWVVEEPNVIFISSCLTYTWEVEYIIGDGGLVAPPGAVFSSAGITTNSNGDMVIPNLPVGRHWLKYTLTNSCGHERECFQELEVYDATPPHAVCDLTSNIALNADMCAYAHPETFDDGSFACSDVTLRIRRLAPGQCGQGSQTSFTDVIKFCCADANQTVLIELEVTSANGEKSYCTVEAFIQDTQNSSFSPPSNRTDDLNCGSSPNLNSQSQLESLYGAPSFSPSLCGGSWTEVLPATYESDECGEGKITRTWRYVSSSGNVSTRTQMITFGLNNPFNGVINYPSDITVNGCRSDAFLPDDLPGVQEPTWNANSCSNIIATYEDLPFYFVEGACMKILRKWTVLDWCQVDGTPGKGIWAATQVIKVNDNVDPSITTGCSLPSTVTGEESGCGEIVSFTATANDNCPEDLSWSATMDNSNIALNIDGATASTNNLNLTAGSHTICWEVIDACGNQDNCCETFNIVDNKPPTPACVSTLTTVITNPNGNTEIWASDFDASSSDNCNNNSQLTFAFSSNPNNTTLGVSCNDLDNGISDTLEVDIYVFDVAGNYDFCPAMLIVQDNSDHCLDNVGTRVDLSGYIMNEGSDMVGDVMIHMNSNDNNMNGSSYMAIEGQYAFDDLSMYSDYEVEAEKNDNHKDGVSTLDLLLIQKHILNIQLLDSPYKLIAADANDSESITALDLIELRKLILGIYDELPNNSSWRFVDSKFQFADAQDPFPFDESVNYDALETDVIDADFVAVKIGDVNESIDLNVNGGTVVSRSNPVEFDLNERVNQESVSFDLNLTDALNIAGLQFTIQYDASNMTFEGMTSELLDINESHFAVIKEGILTFSYASTNDVVIDNNTLISLEFSVNSSDASISLGSAVTAAEIYLNDGNTIVTKGIELRNEANKSFVLHQNVPNPFNANTVISFELPETSAVTLTIYDATGKVIFAKNDEYSKGYNEVIINADTLPNSGILYYQINSYTHTATKKMILLK